MRNFLYFLLCSDMSMQHNKTSFFLLVMTATEQTVHYGTSISREVPSHSTNTRQVPETLDGAMQENSNFWHSTENKHRIGNTHISFLQIFLMHTFHLCLTTDVFKLPTKQLSNFYATKANECKNALHVIILVFNEADDARRLGISVNQTALYAVHIKVKAISTLCTR